MWQSLAWDGAIERRRWGVLAALAANGLALAIVVLFVSANLGGRFQNRGETIAQQLAILHGTSYFLHGVETDWPPFHSRVLFPFLLDSVIKLGRLPPSQWYLLLRIATALGAFMAFSYSLERRAGVRAALIGSWLLALGMIPTFNHGWEHPTDFIDVLVLSVAIGLTRRGSWIILLGWAILGATNHQTAAMSGIIWICMRGWSAAEGVRWSEVLRGGVVIPVTYCATLLIRLAVRGELRAGYEFNGYLTITQFLEVLRHPTPFSWPFLAAAMLTPLALWLWLNKEFLEGEDRRLLVAAAVMFLGSTPVVYLSELRSAFLGPLVLLAFVAGASSSPGSRPAPEADLGRGA